VLDEVVAALRCPVCDRALHRGRDGLHCDAGHTFDLARQGYVNLLTTPAPAGAETPAMVAARGRLFEAGHLAPVTGAVLAQVPAEVRLVLDVGAGTGHHLAAVLTARPGSVGLALDVSKAAARRAAGAHPSIGSVVADVWGRLPLADACVDLLLDVFAPRHGAEFARVLRPSGCLLVVTPTAEHLAELVAPLGLLRVDPGKAERVASLHDWFEPVGRVPCRYGLALSRADAVRFVGMGPSAWHTDPAELAARLSTWPEPVTATVSVAVTAYRPIRRG
jgi:23S rRNA (guanine745-N1)-methyltransferase